MSRPLVIPADPERYSLAISLPIAVDQGAAEFRRGSFEDQGALTHVMKKGPRRASGSCADQAPSDLEGHEVVDRLPPPDH